MKRFGDASILDEMVDCIRHRGPDDRGTWIENDVGLGHRRLSIIDLSDAGHQPMVSADGQQVMVYNGEIYNFRSLRKELGDFNFRSSSDTEVILEAFAGQGDRILPKLNGMFAFAIWDRGKKTITLARDRFGIKPLYYWFDGQNLLFGSEIKCLLKAGIVDRQLDWQGFHEYLHYGTTLESSTVIQGVHRLPPGHSLKYDGDQIRITPFADVLDVQPCEDSYEEATVRVRELLEQSVKLHLVSDVPVGIFLSGGIDSACVTAFASKHYEGKIRTYSAAFDFEPEKNELDNARYISRELDTDHHELMISANNISGDLETLVEHHDVPFGDIANLPLYLLCKELGGETKVILQGDGGDEIFGGYHRYARLQFQTALRIASGLVNPVRSLLPTRSKMYRSLRTMHAFNAPPEELMAWLMSHEVADYLPARVLQDDIVKQLQSTDPFSVFRKRFRRLEKLPPVQRMMYTDATVILPDLYFEKVDRATMAMSVEVRVPMVENALAEYAMTLPWQYKVKRNQKKRILRDALRGIVPGRILDGPKRGLSVPIKQWLNGPLNAYMKDVLLDPANVSWGLFRRDEIESAISRQSDGSQDHGFLLYKLLIFCIWYKKYMCRA